MDDESQPPLSQPHPIVFLDIDGVLNTSKHNSQINLMPDLVRRLKYIIETTDALIVLSTFWRHFHEYITYVLHRHGIDVAKHMLPLPMGATRGKQCTKKFLHFNRLKQQESGNCTHGIEQEGEVNENNNSMVGRSAEDEGEYSSRAEEIEAWLKMYGHKYMGLVLDDDSTPGNGSCKQEDKFHSADWKYAILDDRPSAAKPDTPLFDRFVFTKTELGLTADDAEKAIRLLTLDP